MEIVKNYKNQITALIITIILGVTIILSAVLISTTGFSIKNLGTSATPEGKFVNTISVSGDGKVFVKPDMAELTLSVYETENTSKAALEKVNERTNTIIKLIEDQGIAKKDIQTTNFQVNPEYDWATSGRKLLGYKAVHSIKVTIKNVDEKGTKVSKLIDSISEKDTKIEIQSITFDVENRSNALSEARKLAYEKAESKAKELAKLSDNKLGKAVVISDISYDYNTTTPNTAMKNLEIASSADRAVATEVSTGEMELDIRIQVSFAIE